MGFDYTTGAAIEPPPRDAVSGEREAFGEGAGECPECGRRYGPLIISADWWMMCDVHRLCWCIGHKLTDAWQHVTREDQQQALRLLDGFRVVPATADLGIVDAGEKAAHERLKVTRGTNT